MTNAAYTFVSSVRQGAARLIDTQDTLAETLPNRATLDVALTLNSDPNSKASTTALLYGPGEIKGIDTSAIGPLQPSSMTPDFEPNYFPAIEFKRPDLPWLFTPASPNANDQLRPWICLVVIERHDDTVQLETDWPLPRLKIADASEELPNPADTWAWAHVQVHGSLASGPSLANLVGANSDLVVARLLCARRLKPGTPYCACVVPTFMSGRQAGLGDPVTTTDLTYAWKTTDKNFSLPVFFHWEFTTGAAGDFESLVRRLAPRQLPDGVGTRDLDVSHAGGGLPGSTKPLVLGLEGALRAPGARPTPWPRGLGKRFQMSLRNLLDSPAGASSQGPAVLAPPIYGRWHAARDTIPSATPNWLRELNLDPRGRVAAAMGTLVVQEEQEDLMAAAWKQVGEIKRVNNALQQAQMARASGRSTLERHLAPLPADRLLQLAGPAHRRLLEGNETVRSVIEKSCLPVAAVSPPFRRLLRPRGPLGRRRAAAAGAAGGQRGGALIARLASGQLHVAPPPIPPGGTVTIDQVSQVRGVQNQDFSDFTGQAVLGAPQQHFVVRGPEGQVEPGTASGTDDAGATAFRAAAAQQQTAVLDTASDTRPGCRGLKVAPVASRMLASLDPGVTVPARVKARISMPAGAWNQPDPLEPVMAAPSFPMPMYEPLRELSQDWLLPGLEKVPQNSLTVLESNPRFIESYMVGLNHEMSSELLWREYPTDQRGTYFRQFWDLSARVPQPTDDAGREQLKDIKPIDKWPAAKHLGDAMGAGDASNAQLVLLIRGELLKRYPLTEIYAVEAVWSGNQRRPSTSSSAELYPIFKGTLDPDVTFFAFDLDEATARGSTTPQKHPGWFVVIQQPMTDPRFGLDDSGSYEAGKPASWADLSWGHMAANQADYEQLTHAPVTGSRAEAWTFSNIPAVKWGATGQAAHTALIALQRPVRVSVHADDMLPPP